MSPILTTELLCLEGEECEGNPCSACLINRYRTALREIAPVVLKLTNDFITDNAHLPFAELLIANFKPNIDKLYAEVNRIATEALEVKDE